VTVSGNSSIFTFNLSCTPTPSQVGCAATSVDYTCQIDNAAFINYVEMRVGGVYYNASQLVNLFSITIPLAQQNTTLNSTINLTQERIHDTNGGYVNAFVQASIQRDCAICSPNVQIIQACNTTNEQIVNITYTPNGCNNDTAGVQSCTYCTPYWSVRQGGIYDCSNNGTKLQYYEHRQLLLPKRS
jgi:hypothetical protein